MLLIFSNRDVFVIGKMAEGGLYANAVWLKQKTIAGTDQELWHNKAKHGVVAIPRHTAQVHTQILLPYVNPVEATARNGQSSC